MKPISKTAYIGTAVCAAALSLAPFLAMAQRTGNMAAPETRTTTGTPIMNQNTFCTRFANLGEATKNRLNERYGQVAENKQDRINQFKKNRQERDQKMKQVRDQAASTTDAVMQQLMERAQTEAQKQAVTTFQQQVRTAAAVRKAAVDAAMNDFRQGLDNEAASREQAAQQAASQYRTAVQAAIAKAKSDCSAGTDPEQVRSAYMAALKNAQQTLQQARQGLDNRGETIRQLTQTRNQAVRKAAEDFKTAMEQARAQLKLAFQTQEQTQQQDQEQTGQE